MVFEDSVRQGGEEQEAGFNIVGWNSSYTGEPLGAAAMREQVEATVERIRGLAPRQVLEIGCGTGLLLLPLAREAESYWGTDFSRAALGYVERQLGAGRGKVRLLERGAEDFSGLPPRSFDTVILNSVVQYFPSMDYLVEVLEGALEVVAEGGRIFVGDVRHLGLLEAFHMSVELYRAAAWERVSELGERVRQRLGQEEELVIEPGFFRAWKQRQGRVRAVEIEPKRGYERNELTLFRYDVVLAVGEGREAGEAIDWQEWGRFGEVTALRRWLERERPERVGIRGIVNGRVQEAVKAQELVREEAVGTVGELREALAGMAGGVEPEALWRLSEEVPYEVHVSWAAGREGMLEAVLRRRQEGERRRVMDWGGEGKARAWASYGTHPLQGKLAQKLVPVLRRHLEEQLPDYMVPSAFVLLNRMPLSPNGKVNRRALPAPDMLRPALEAAYVQPRNPVEEVLASIWAEVLNIDRAGIFDNFFEAGGHSLLATQLVSRIRDTLQIDLPLREIFRTPTVAGLAESLRGDERVECAAKLLVEVGALSEQEVAAELAARRLA
jgi:SAM-dependent methyltransferase/acyl carrier protein